MPVHAQEIRFNCSGYIWQKAGWQQETAEESYFIINENGNELMHFTPHLVSFYYIDNWHFDSEKNTLKAYIVSDADNRYQLEINEEKGSLHFWILDGENAGADVIYTIK